MGNGTESIEAPVKCEEEDSEDSEDLFYSTTTLEPCEEDVELTAALNPYKPLLGVIIFVCFVLYGLAYPIWTRCGCCGKWKPTDQKEDEFGTNEEGNDIKT